MWIPFARFLELKRNGSLTPEYIKKFLNEVALSFAVEQAGLLLDIILVLFMHSQFEQSLPADIFKLLGVSKIPPFLFEFAFEQGKPFRLVRGGALLVEDPTTASLFAFQRMVKKAHMFSTIVLIVLDASVNEAFFFAFQVELTKAICANPSLMEEPQRAARLRSGQPNHKLSPGEFYLLELAKKIVSKRSRFYTSDYAQRSGESAHKRLCTEGISTSAPLPGDHELNGIKLTPCAQKIVKRVNSESKKHPIHEERMLVVNTFFPYFGQERIELFLSWVQNRFFPPSSDPEELKKRKACLDAFKALVKGFISRPISPSCCYYAKRGLCSFSDSDLTNMAIQKEICFVKAGKTNQNFSPRLMVAAHLLS